MDKPLSISFQLIKKSVLIVGDYDPATVDPVERMNAWSLIHETGFELMAHLIQYDAKVHKVIQYEVTNGQIVFDVQTSANRETKQRCVAACEESLREPATEEVAFMIAAPEGVQ